MRLIVTGFGPFQGVEDNPSRIVAKNAVHVLMAKGYDVQYTELVVSMKAVQQFYQRLPDSDTFVLHIGVNARAKTMFLESEAFNEATFSVPDEDGEQPNKEKIMPIYEFNESIKNKIDIDAAVKELMPRFQRSDDAGRFVCNYAYFFALHNTKSKIRGAQFIHVPYFDKVSETDQTYNVVRYIDYIYSLPEFQDAK